ncbi:MAG TPA: Gldg family protein [Acetobacteraceae bacterium]|nr:Gldg family protein [Acetobacteraceae bacterium]
MLPKSMRSWIEAGLFVLALGLGIAAALGPGGETTANSLFFAAWFAALVLLFSLGLRVPSRLRGRLSPLTEGGLAIGAAGLALLANIALYRHDTHFDVTVTGRFTAPPEFETVVRSLDRDVTLSYFYNSQDDNARVASTVLAAIARKRPHLHVRTLDLDKELIAARNYGVRLYNTAIIEADGRRAEIDNTVDLRQMAFGLERALRQSTPTVCFVAGHGEPYDSGHVHFNHVEVMHGDEIPGSSDVLEAPSFGIDRLKMALEAIGYSDRAIEPATIRGIPANCAVLVDLGPRRPYAPDEASLLRDYLARGGRALLMFDPEFPVAPDLARLLDEVGLAVGDGVVIDPLNHYGTEPEKAAVPYYPPHPITDQVALTVFPGARPVRLMRQVPGTEGAELIATSKDSYVRPLHPTVPAAARPQESGRGPVTLALKSEGNWPGSAGKPFRLVLVGSASFAVNEFFPYASNGDLAVSMVRWLAEDMATPKLKPESYSLPEVRLTHTEMQVTFVLIEVLLPLSVMLLGVAVWWRRR